MAHTHTHTTFLAEEVDDGEDVPMWNDSLGEDVQPTVGHFDER